MAFNRREYYLKNKERFDAISKQYYWDNREKVLAGNKEYLQENREARTEYFRKYRATPEGKAATLRAIRKYEVNNPERRKAWTKAQRIEKQPCLECGETNSHKHHPDITKPLDVIFLCPLHHKQAHL